MTFYTNTAGVGLGADRRRITPRSQQAQQNLINYVLAAQASMERTSHASGLPSPAAARQARAAGRARNAAAAAAAIDAAAVGASGPDVAAAAAAADGSNGNGTAARAALAAAATGASGTDVAAVTVAARDVANAKADHADGAAAAAAGGGGMMLALLAGGALLASKGFGAVPLRPTGPSIGSTAAPPVDDRMTPRCPPGQRWMQIPHRLGDPAWGCRVPPPIRWPFAGFGAMPFSPGVLTSEAALTRPPQQAAAPVEDRMCPRGQTWVVTNATLNEGVCVVPAEQAAPPVDDSMTPPAYVPAAAAPTSPSTQAKPNFSSSWLRPQYKTNLQAPRLHSIVAVPTPAAPSGGGGGLLLLLAGAALAFG